MTSISKLLDDAQRDATTAEVFRRWHNAMAEAKAVYTARTGEAQAEYEAAVLAADIQRFNDLMACQLEAIVAAAQGKVDR